MILAYCSVPTIIGNELLPIIIDEQTFQNTQTNLAFNWNA